MEFQIDPAAAYEHAKREGAHLVEQMIGDLAAKSAAIDQLAEANAKLREENEKLAERLAALDKPPERPANGKPKKETIDDIYRDSQKATAKIHREVTITEAAK